MADINPRAHEYQEYRQAVRELCGQFDSKYWQAVDERSGYPDEFIKALTRAGWLAALIPEQYGGGGLNVTEASVILEEINRSGANSGACHAQMYIMGALLRHGSEEQKRKYLPGIASGELRLQSFAVTEPTTGIDARRILPAGACVGDGYWSGGKARTYAGERTVFARPIGRNQGVQFPIARAYANVRAADRMRFEAARLFDGGKPAGAEANRAT